MQEDEDGHMVQSGEKDLRARRQAKVAEKERKQHLLDAAWGDEVS